MKKNILVITYWSFNDALIQTYTLPYVKIMARVSGSKIYVVCLEQAKVATSKAERLQINNSLKEHNIEVVFFEYNRFGVKQALLWGANLVKLLYLILNKQVGYLHTWCTPGGAIGYLLSVLSGRALILDSYEPHAELMLETGTWARSGMAFKILFKLEKLQTRRAKVIIGVVDKMQQYSADKYQVKINPSNFYVKPACVDMDMFYPREKTSALVDELGLKNKIVGVYAGKFGGIYLENELFDFLKQCYNYWGDSFAMLMLTSAPESFINSQLSRAGVPAQCVIKKFVSHTEVPVYMALGDFAVNFMKPVPARRFSTPIKNGEYWAMGLPVVITANISDDSDIIERNDAGYVLKGLNDDECKCAIVKIDKLLEGDINGLKERIVSLAHKYRNYDIAVDVYKKIYNDERILTN